MKAILFTILLAAKCASNEERTNPVITIDTPDQDLDASKEVEDKTPVDKNRLSVPERKKTIIKV